MGGPDFSTLPDLVLVELFQALPLTERGRLASCCHRLSAFMNLRALWTEVTISMDVDIDVSQQKVAFVDRLNARDRVMTEKYGQYFQNVKVVMTSGHLGDQSIDVLTELCERGVIESVSLRFDIFASKLIKWLPEVEMVQRFGDEDTWLTDLMFPSRDQNGLWIIPPTTEGVIEKLSPDVPITIVLHPQVDSRGFFEKSIVSLARTYYFVQDLYNARCSEKCCSLLKKLVLPITLCHNKDLSNALFPSPPARLISMFPNLEEFHVNTANLSDQLLLELSGASGRRKPLRSLVMRNIDIQYSEISGFPRLSSAAWDQLAQSSPSLTVECCLVTVRLPLLSDLIKPETPLVKLKVICIRSDKQSELMLHGLCKSHSDTLQHFHLSIFFSMTRPHSKQLQESLKNMVLACPRLQHLLCDVDIHHQILLDLARLPRQWRTFRFNLSRINAHKVKLGATFFSCWRSRFQLFKFRLTKEGDVLKTIQNEVGFLDKEKVEDFIGYVHEPQRHLFVRF